MRGRGPARASWVSRLEERFADPCGERGKTARPGAEPRGSTCVTQAVWLMALVGLDPGPRLARYPGVEALFGSILRLSQQFVGNPQLICDLINDVRAICIL